MVTPPASRPVILGAPDVNVAITPDGTRLVYRATIDSLPYLFVRPLAELEATPAGRADGAASQPVYLV